MESDAGKKDSKKKAGKKSGIVPGLYSKDGIWYYQGSQRNGIRPRAQSLRTKDLTEAILAANALRQEELLGSSMGRVSSLRMTDVIPTYLDEKEFTKVFSPRSKINAEVMLRGIARALLDPPLSQITEARIRKYRESLHRTMSRRGKPVTESTVQTYLTRLKGFLTWCQDRKYIRSSPMTSMRLPRVKKSRISEFATIAERTALLTTPCSENIATILHLGFYAGLRFGEMISLRWMDLDRSGDTMSIKIHAHDWFAPKGKQARVVPVPNVLRDYLHSIRRNGSKATDYIIAPDAAWLPKHAKAYRHNPKRAFSSHAKKSGITWHITYHHLRHSYVTHHMSRGTSLALIAQWTGDTEEVLVSNYAGFYPSHEAVNAIE